MCQSLDNYEKTYYLKPNIRELPLSGELLLTDSIFENPTDSSVRISLDGEWDLIEQCGDMDFSNAVKAYVPGSVHLALLKSGKITDAHGNLITDPYYAKNDEYLREISKKSFILRKIFNLNAYEASKSMRLSFKGVCDTCEVYLNQRLLGKHVGTFGGPDFDVTGFLKQGENELIVLLHAAHFRKRKPFEFPTFFGGGNPWLNLGWLDTVTFNCVYGWHYADIPPLGIWRSVELCEISDKEIENPFIYTKNLNGKMHLKLGIRSKNYKSAIIKGRITPKNFEDKVKYFSFDLKVNKGFNEFVFELNIENPRLWWPNGLGKQNLYILELWICEDDIVFDSKKLQFGIRSVETIPNCNKNNKRISETGKYNWTFVVNGVPFFIKGTGWCTNDAIMRFEKERYERFLTLAKKQNINMVRAWGGGLVETDEFYDICDEYGIAVFQEWPTAWDSYMIQPKETLLETVEHGVLRLRNRASLFLWCGGNEGCAPLEANEIFDPEVLNEMGKRTLELDNTRPWHRQEPCGGSIHDYRASWEGKNPTSNMTMEADFIGEFGVDCWPNFESVKRFTPSEELIETDRYNFFINPDGVIAHHTPMFNKSDDVLRQQKHVHLFIEPDSMKNSIIGSQLAQVVGLRYTLERARTRWPQCSGAIMYKLNDPYPAASWSTVDWYGVPKAAHYFVSRAYAPIAAFPRLDKSEFADESVEIPVYLCNDILLNKPLKVNFRVYDSNGEVRQSESFNINAAEKVKLLGTVILNEEITKSIPFFIVTEVFSDKELIFRNWYFLNYERRRGCLFCMPKTKLSIMKNGNAVKIKNIGNFPAIAVQFDCETVSDKFLPDNNFIWVDGGEEVEIYACDWTGVRGVFSWNTDKTEFDV